MATVESILKKKSKDWDCENLMGGANKPSGSKIPFSSPLMNWATYGGIPRDKISEFYGEPGGGKTTTCVDICKNALEIFKMEYEELVDELRTKISHGDKSAAAKLADLEDVGPKKVLYIDLEHSFDNKWSKTLGIDNADWVMQPPDITAEEVLQTTLDLIATGELGLVVLDSIPSLVPSTVLEKKIGERTVAALAGLLTTFVTKLVPMLTRYGCTFIFINQVRDNMDNPYVDNTPGGKGIKFYSSLRIRFRLGKPVDILGNELPTNAENPDGYKIQATLMKQKSAPWDRKNATYFLMSQSGIRPDFDFAQLALKEGVIQKSGAWFTLCDPSTGAVVVDDSGKPCKLNGLARVYDYLNNNADYYGAVKKYILDKINGIESDSSPEEIGGLS